MPNRPGAFGRYEIRSLAGSGGMGDVFQGVDVETQERVAIKMLRGSSEADRARFEREARALADLRHPAIVRYISHGHTADAQPYLVMEWLEGEDFEARLTRGRCTVDEAVAVVRRAAEGLAVVHALGVVHRDIKPSNLFLVDGRIDELKLLDFGIARMARTRMTRTGAFLGTPGYMAPEQARGYESVTPAADVFSLGCVLFEALTGRPAFQGNNPLAVLAKLIFEESPGLGDACPEAPAQLEALLGRMLAKHPEERPRDASALLAELADAAPRRAVVVATTRKMAPPGPRLTAAERRIVSVVLIRERGGLGEAEDGAGTLLAMPPAPTLIERLEATAEAADGRFAYLADRSMVVTITGLGAAKDRVTHAARFALSLRELVGERQIVLTTGSVEDTGGNGLGEAIERAVRRLTQCPTSPGEGPLPIAIDKSTAALLDYRFEWHDSAAGPELWGERGSVDVVRNLLGRPAPCVGRERDLSTLTEAFRDCVDESLAQAVLVVAPAGVGKSRLSQEFVRSAHARGPVEVWSAQGDPFRVDSSLMLMGGALRSAVGIAGAEPVPERHAKLRAAVAGLLPAAEQRRVAEFIGEIIGAPFPDDDSPQLRAARHDAAAMAEQMQQALGEFVAARCRRGPVMLVLEELHWSDAMSVRFVDTLLRDLAELPLFVLALARPEVGERFPTLWSARRLQQIRLGPLSRRASERLVRQVLGADIDAATCERLVDKAEGNAFYLEELIRAIAEGQTALPDTVIAMAQSRIEGLELELRRTLRAASVFGSVFWSGGVGALLGEDTSMRAVDGWLTRLVEREFLVRRKQSRFAGEDELEFRHALLREGAYSMLTDEDRRLGHEIAGAWLQQYDDVDARVLAEHCERSEQRERAVHFYMLAAEESWDNNDPDAAGPCAERGLQLGADGETRGVLLSVLAGVRSRQERHDESEAHCTEALALLPPGSRRWVRTFHVLFPVVARTRPARLGELLHAFFDIEPEPGTRAEQIHAVTWIYAILTITGVLDASATLLADMRRTFRAIERPDVLTRAFMDAAESVHADLVAGSPWQHMIRSRDSALAFQEVGLRGYQCIQASFYGKALAELGDHATATAILRDNLATAERFGDPVSLSYARLFLARLLLSSEAEPPLDEVVALATEVVAARNESLVGLALAALADCKLRRGDLAGAEVDARLACERTRPFAGYWWGTAALHGRILLALGRPAEAFAVLDDAMARLDQLDMGGYGDIELCLVAAEVWHDHERREPARRALARVVERLRARVDGLPPEHRRAYLTCVAPHARALALAGEWLGPGALTGLDAPA